MFVNRKDGGEKLGRALEHYRHQPVLVLGIARGGVETAYYVARYLQATLSVVITRKLGYPDNPEAAFGALAEDGSYFIFKDGEAGLNPDEIQSIITREQKEIQRRIRALRKGKPLPDLKGKTVIIVDDGIATGATLFATIALCKKNRAKKIIVAAPIASDRMANILKKEVDDVVILSTPTVYYAVSQGYQYFNNLTDDEVLAIMNRWEHEMHATIT